MEAIQVGMILMSVIGGGYAVRNFKYKKDFLKYVGAVTIMFFLVDPVSEYIEIMNITFYGVSIAVLLKAKFVGVLGMLSLKKLKYF